MKVHESKVAENRLESYCIDPVMQKGNATNKGVSNGINIKSSN